MNSVKWILDNVPKILSNTSTKIQMNPKIDKAMDSELKTVLNAHSKYYAFLS